MHWFDLGLVVVTVIGLLVMSLYFRTRMQGHKGNLYFKQKYVVRSEQNYEYGRHKDTFMIALFGLLFFLVITVVSTDHAITGMVVSVSKVDTEITVLLFVLLILMVKFVVTEIHLHHNTKQKTL